MSVFQVSGLVAVVSAAALAGRSAEAPSSPEAPRLVDLPEYKYAGAPAAKGGEAVKSENWIFTHPVEDSPDRPKFALDDPSLKPLTVLPDFHVRDPFAAFLHDADKLFRPLPPKFSLPAGGTILEAKGKVFTTEIMLKFSKEHGGFDFLNIKW